MGVDRRDWAMFADCFTDPVYADFSEGGIPAATISRADLVARISTALNGFTVTQHISPNHVIEFDASDPDRPSATPACTRSTCCGDRQRRVLPAARLLHQPHAPDPGGLALEGIIQHRSWEYENTNAVTEARSQAQAPANQPSR